MARTVFQVSHTLRGAAAFLKDAGKMLCFFSEPSWLYPASPETHTHQCPWQQPGDSLVSSVALGFAPSQQKTKKPYRFPSAFLLHCALPGRGIPQESSSPSCGDLTLHPYDVGLSDGQLSRSMGSFGGFQMNPHCGFTALFKRREEMKGKASAQSSSSGRAENRSTAFSGPFPRLEMLRWPECHFSFSLCCSLVRSH